jgi:hypothetical protein
MPIISKRALAERIVAVSALDARVDSYVRRRNCDAAIERSPSLEALDEVSRLLGCHAPDVKVQVDGIEDGQVLPYRSAAVHGRGDLNRNRSRRELLLPRDHLHQLDTACCDAGNEDLGGTERFARTAVLHGTVYDEMLIAGAA